MPANHNDIKSRLWEAANILRGSAVDRTDWKAYPSDISLKEVTRSTGISRMTVSKYLGILKAGGRIKVSRVIGNVILYKLGRD